jgi:hypothetical protein
MLTSKNNGSPTFWNGESMDSDMKMYDMLDVSVIYVISFRNIMFQN